ncbi:MAG: hypothetical protein ACYTGX_07485 [Planctomycetota bacterium]
MNDESPESTADQPEPKGALPKRLAEAAAIAGVGAVAAGAVARGQAESLYCCGDRTCTKTQEHCPAGISRQDELAAAARGGDHPRFVRYGGLACTRCGNCEPHCGERLPLAQLFADTQRAVSERLDNAELTPALVTAAHDALMLGLVGPEFIDRVGIIIREISPDDA